MSGRNAAIYSARARWIALGAFVIVAFLFGGSSRHDAATLVLLRPLSALFLAYAVIGLLRKHWREFRTLFVLLIALVLLTWAQMIPLPPSLWTAFPARETVSAIGEELGMGDLWRPLTMSPTKTWNALYALIVPAAALTLFAIQGPDGRRNVWMVILLAAIASVVLGILQVLGGRGSSLYFYPFAQPGYAAGLFANRNHQGVFLATMLVVCAWWFASVRSDDKKAALKGFLSMASLVLILPAIFLAGSRAGLICAALAAAIALWLIASAPLVPQTVKFGRRVSVSRRALFGGMVALLATLVAAIALSSRGLALERLLADESLEDLRWRVMPVLGEMAGDQALVGTGFGAFEYAYKIYEPVELLSPRYFNNAHNDWAQFVIEGGAVAIILLIVFITLFAIRTLAAWRGNQGEDRRRRLMAAAVIAIFGIASVVDYPLRAPSITVVFAIACATLWRSRSEIVPSTRTARPKGLRQ